MLVKNAFRASDLKKRRVLASTLTPPACLGTGLAASGHFLAVLAPSLLKIFHPIQRDQGIARRAPRNAAENCCSHAEKPNTQSAGAAFNRMRSRSRQAGLPEVAKCDVGYAWPLASLSVTRSYRGKSRHRAGALKASRMTKSDHFTTINFCTAKAPHGQLHSPDGRTIPLADTLLSSTMASYRVSIAQFAT